MNWEDCVEPDQGSNSIMYARGKTFGALLSALFVMLFTGIAFSVASAEIGMPAPEISGQSWVNSKPLNLAELKGKVVLLEFWTFGCFNCRNVEPYVKGWHQKYADKGLVVIGVHSPEFSYERSVANVQNYIREHAIKYPVVIDNDFKTWNRYSNRYWPAMYLVDKRGIMRYLRVGEGGYEQTEKQILALLEESMPREM
jgi:thiol-disulfide isomerase/thioredoxin